MTTLLYIIAGIVALGFLFLAAGAGAIAVGLAQSEPENDEFRGEWYES